MGFHCSFYYKMNLSSIPSDCIWISGCVPQICLHLLRAISLNNVAGEDPYPEPSHSMPVYTPTYSARRDERSNEGRDKQCKYYQLLSRNKFNGLINW